MYTQPTTPTHCIKCECVMRRAAPHAVFDLCHCITGAYNNLCPAVLAKDNMQYNKVGRGYCDGCGRTRTRIESGFSGLALCVDCLRHEYGYRLES